MYTTLKITKFKLKPARFVFHLVEEDDLGSYQYNTVEKLENYTRNDPTNKRELPTMPLDQKEKELWGMRATVTDLSKIALAIERGEKIHPIDIVNNLPSLTAVEDLCARYKEAVLALDNFMASSDTLAEEKAKWIGIRERIEDKTITLAEVEQVLSDTQAIPAEVDPAEEYLTSLKRLCRTRILHKSYWLDTQTFLLDLISARQQRIVGAIADLYKTASEIGKELSLEEKITKLKEMGILKTLDEVEAILGCQKRKSSLFT